MTKKSQNALSESILRATLYSIGDAVIATDKRGRVTLMNPVAEKLTGWKEHEARGKALSTVFRIVNEETRKKVESPVARVLREGIVVGLANHTILISRNGKEIPIADAGAPIKDESGKVVGVVLVFRDQTAERTAQRAVQDAREFAESIIATVREPLLVLDEKLGVVAANRSFYSVFKVKPEETIGEKVYRLGNGQWNIPALRKLLEDILPSNSHFDDFEITHDFEHIGRRTMLLNARRLFREANRSKLILLAIEDITERKRAEEALKESDERFRRITNIISDYAYTFRVNPDRTLTGEWLSESFTKVFGFTQQEIQARGGWQSMVYPEDLPLMQQHALKVAGGTADVCETRFVTRSGEVRWIRDYATPVWDDKQQRVVRIYGAAQDITEQKKAEQAVREREEWFRRLADTTSTAIFIYQGERFVYANKATEELSGYTNQELLSLRFWDVVHPDFRDLVRQRGLARQRGEAVPNRYEFPIVRKDGSVRWIDFTAGKIDWQGKPAAIGTAFDVTERKRVEQSLRENEQRYRSIVENINQAYYEADRRAAFTYCNPGLLILSGYTAEELLGTISYRLIAEEDRRKVIAQYEQWLKEKRTDMAMEFRVQTKSGRIFWVEQVSHFEFDAQGNFVKATNVLRDIDERKRAEEELRKSEDRYRTLFHSVSEAILISDAEGRYIEVNEEARNLTGYSRDELLRMTVGDLVEGDREDLLNGYRIFHKQMRTRRLFRAADRRMRRKDGTVFEYEVNAVYLENDLVMAMIRDITERKRAEQEILQSRERYERFFMEDLTGDYISTPDGRLLACNPAFVRIFGFASEQEALNTNVASLFHTPEERQRFLSRLQRERKLEYYEMQMRKRDGTPLYIIANMIGRFDEHDRLVEMQGYLFDDTKRHQTEEILRQTQRLESIGTLASGIAHDFNNILAIIMGHASLLEQLHDDRQKLAKRAETILKATERGASLVKQLLTFARKAETVLEPFDVNLLIREMGKMLRETFPRDIELQLHLEKDLPAIIVDANQLHQVVLNLCVNARDSMPNGGTLTIATSRVEAELLSHRFPNIAAREYLALTISDTGVGIDPQIRDRIFEPFFTTKAPGHGTGLGLAVVHGIVSSHGGFIDVESEVGKGTVFSLFFPIPERPVQLSPVASVEAETVRGGTETILLVEDEEMLRTMMMMLLESKGYRVLTASDGEEGIELYQQRRHDIQLVLSDYGLPKLNGAELFRRVRALDPHARVILASGFYEPQLRADLVREGIAQLLSKPYRAATVLNAIRTVLDSTESAHGQE